MAIHIKKGDTVKVIAGDHKGATGKVIRVLKDKGRVVIEGVNLAYKHARPSQQNPQGGRIRVEQPVNISNVQPVGKGDKAVRTKIEMSRDGGKKLVGVDGSEIRTIVYGKK